MALNSTVVAKAQADTRGNFHSIQVRTITTKFYENFFILCNAKSEKFSIAYLAIAYFKRTVLLFSTLRFDFLKYFSK